MILKLKRMPETNFTVVFPVLLLALARRDMMMLLPVALFSKNFQVSDLPSAHTFFLFSAASEFQVSITFVQPLSHLHPVESVRGTAGSVRPHESYMMHPLRNYDAAGLPYCPSRLRLLVAFRGSSSLGCSSLRCCCCSHTSCCSSLTSSSFSSCW